MPVQEPSEQQQHVLAHAAVLPPTFIKAAGRIVACEWLHTHTICSCSISWLGCSASCRSAHRLLLPCLYLMLAAAGSAEPLDVQLLSMRAHCDLYRCGCPAVGDIHGDLQKAVTALETAGVLTEHNQSVKWTGSNTVVVQLGDVLDRGDSEIGAQSDGAGRAPCSCWHHCCIWELHPGGHRGSRAGRHADCCHAGCQCMLYSVKLIDL